VDDFSILDTTEPSKTWITFFLSRIEQNLCTLHISIIVQAKDMEQIIVWILTLSINKILILQRKADYDQVQAQCEEMKKEVNMVVGEHAQTEVRKKEICVYIKVKKGKVVPLCSIQAHLGDRRYSSYSFLTSALEGGEWSASRPGLALPPGKGPPVPIV
jgi:hypothetical protein